MATRHTVHQDRVEYLLRSPTGPVARDLLKRGLKVESRAKLLLAGGGGRPKRIDTARLRSSIRTVPGQDNGAPVVRIGTAVHYARWVHSGTGIYGPLHRPIRPTRARFLRFRPKGSTRFVYARSVKGMRGNAFLADALSAAGARGRR